MKHTPAPWKVVIDWEDRHPIAIIDPTTENHTVGALHICNINPNLGGESFANASLIAAAPELLEALKVAQAWLSNIRTDQKGLNILVDAMPRDDYGLEKLRAAIAKAEGR